MKTKTNLDFPTSPFADEDGDGIEVLDPDGFIVRRDENCMDTQGLDLVDDDGFIVPPSFSNLSHVFERVEKVHLAPGKTSLEEEPCPSISFDATSKQEDTFEVEAQDINVIAVKPDDADEDQDNNSEDGSKVEQQQRVGVMAVFQFGQGRKKWCGLVLGIVCAAISGCVYPIMAFVLSSTFRVLSVPTSDEFRADIREMAFIFMLIGVIALVSVTSQIVLLETAAEEMTYSLKTEWFDSLLRQDMTYFDLQDISKTAMLISTAGAQYKNGIGRKLGEGVQFFFMFLGGFVYAFYCSWRTSLVLLAVVPFMSASILFLMKTSQSQTRRSKESYAEAGSIVLMAASAIRTVYSLNASNLLIDKYCKATERAYQATASRVALLGLANGMVMGSILFLRSAVLTLYGSYLLYDQVRSDGCDPSGALIDLNTSCDPDGQSIFGALIGITLGAAGIPQLSLALEAFSDARAACYPAMSVMERKLEGSTAKDNESSSKKVSCSTLVASLPKYEIDSSSSDGKSASSFKGDISFNHVRFSYPSRPESLVLDNFCLSLKPGQTIGVVGPSGSGKSTIVSLLERFYDTTSGNFIVCNDIYLFHADQTSSISCLA